MRGQVVVVDTPHVCSMAALVLLGREYRRAELARWLRFRDALLDEAEAEHGQLVCAYCGQEGLVREVPDYVRKPANLATIDHVMPVSKGGGRFDRNNCEIACYPCNQRKGDSVPV